MRDAGAKGMNSGCRKLMEHGLSIVAELNSYIQNDSEGEKFVTSEEILDVCTYHTQLLLCIDRY
eukprot:13275185-Ditylum_brightwellii.AAC.1